MLGAAQHLRAVRLKLQVPPLRCPGFPVQRSGLGELRAAFFTESRIRGVDWRSVVGNPESAPTARRGRRDDKGESSAHLSSRYRGMDRAAGLADDQIG